MRTSTKIAIILLALGGIIAFFSVAFYIFAITTAAPLGAVWYANLGALGIGVGVLMFLTGLIIGIVNLVRYLLNRHRYG